MGGGVFGDVERDLLFACQKLYDAASHGRRGLAVFFSVFKAESRRFAERENAGKIFRSRAESFFLAAAEKKGRELQPFFDIQSAHAFWAVDLMGREGHQIHSQPAGVDVAFHIALHGIAKNQTSGIFPFDDAGKGGDVVDRAGFVVGVHHGVKNRLFVGGFGHFFKIQFAVLGREVNDLEALFFQGFHTFGNGGMLGIGSQNAVALPTELLCRAEMGVPGHHMITDGLAAATVAHSDGIDGVAIAEGLRSYRGIARRMELIGKTATGADVFDDYAHHPTEITNTLEAARELGYKRTVCVFQPHTFSRTAELLDGFADALGNSRLDEIVLAEIYPAREVNTYGISSEKLCEEVVKRGMKCNVIGSFEGIAEYLKNSLGHDDAVFIVGAGDVNKISKMITK